MDKLDYYKKVLYNAPDMVLWGILDHNKEDILIYWINKNIEKIINIDLIGKKFFESFSIYKRDIVNNSLEDYIKNEPIIVEYIPQMNSFCKIKIKKLMNKYVVVRFNNVYETEEFIFKNIIDNEQLFIWTKSIDRRYMSISKKYIDFYTKYLNVNCDNYIGKRENEILPIGEKSIFEKEEKEIIEGKYNEIQVVKEIRGRKLSVKLTPFIVDNKIQGCIGKGIELSEKNTPINRRKENENMLKQICNSIYDGIFFMDKKEIEERFVTDKHKDNENYTNNKIEEIVYKDNSILQAYKNKLEKSDIVSYIDKEQEKKSIEIIKIPLLDKNGDVPGVCIIVKDVTKRIEEEEKVENDRQEFFFNISHEFRTPLNLILTSIELINYISKDSNNYEKYKKYYEIINRNCFLLLKYVNMIINATKLDIGEIVFEPKELDLVRKIEDIFDNMIEYAKANDVEMIFDTEFEELKFLFDEEKMEIIITNLLTNAIKYNKENGMVILSISKNRDNINIRVTDNGIGMPEEKLDEIFEKFKQIRNDKTEINKGSGIGLYLVKTYTELHGGRIEVRSKIDKGTEFNVILPISKKNSQSS